MYNLQLELDIYRKKVDYDSFMTHAMDRVLNPKNRLDYHLAAYMIGSIEIYDKYETEVLNPFNTSVLCSWKVPLYTLEYDFIKCVNSNYSDHIIHNSKLGIEFYEDNIVCVNGIYLGIDRLSEIKFRPPGQVIYERLYCIRNYLIGSFTEIVLDEYLQNQRELLVSSVQDAVDNSNELTNSQDATGIYSEALLEDKDLSEYIPTGKKVSVEDIDDLIKNIDSLIAKSDDESN